jgi:tryptophan 2,3-dioxygenase
MNKQKSMNTGSTTPSKEQFQTYYPEYLKLDQLLSSQTPLSHIHDEHLFIIIHQVYELYFKQILHELDALLLDFSPTYIDDSSLFYLCRRLERIQMFIDDMPSKLKILETMTPMDFMDFRDKLIPASGFQSLQFRLIELKLGLFQEGTQQGPFFTGVLQDTEKAIVEKTLSQKNLKNYLNDWLTRMPFAVAEDFWNKYQEKMKERFANDRHIIEQLQHLTADKKTIQLNILQATENQFKQFCEDISTTNQQGLLSGDALKAALFIMLYRSESIMHVPFKLLETLMNIDESLANWRQAHSLLAERMLGQRIGTGGSSGHAYLKSTVTSRRIFSELFMLISYLLPSSYLPTLSNDIKNKMNFHY